MQSFPIEAVPEAGLVHIACFTEVKNASALKERLQAQDKTLAVGLVESNLILDVFQLLVAATKAALDERAGKLRTNSVNAEIVYNLSSTNSIAESLKRFGISDNTTSLLAIKIGGEPDAALAEMTKTVEGTLTSFSKLEEEADLATLRKYFKIDPKVTDKSQILSWIIGGMALKNVQ